LTHKQGTAESKKTTADTLHRQPTLDKSRNLVCQ